MNKLYKPGTWKRPLLWPDRASSRWATLTSLKIAFDHEDCGRSDHLLRRGSPLLYEYETTEGRLLEGANVKPDTNLSFDKAFPTAQFCSGSPDLSMDT